MQTNQGITRGCSCHNPHTNSLSKIVVCEVLVWKGAGFGAAAAGREPWTSSLMQVRWDLGQVPEPLGISVSPLIEWELWKSSHRHLPLSSHRPSHWPFAVLPTADKGIEVWPGVVRVPRPCRAWHPPSQDAPLSPQGASLGPIISSQEVRLDGGGSTGICCIIK